MDKLIIVVAICFIFSLVNGSNSSYKESNEGSKLSDSSGSTTKKPFFSCCFNLGNSFSFIKQKICRIFGKKEQKVSTRKSSVQHQIDEKSTTDVSPLSAIINTSTSESEKAHAITHTTNWTVKRYWSPRNIWSTDRRGYYMTASRFTFPSRSPRTRKYFTPSKPFTEDTTKSSSSLDLPQHLYTTKLDSSTSELFQNRNVAGMDDLLSDLLDPSVMFSSLETDTSTSISKPLERTTNAPISVSKPRSNVYQYNSRKLLNDGSSNYYHVRRGRNNSTVTVRRILGPLNDSYVSSQIVALHNMLKGSNPYARRTHPAPYEIKQREVRYTTGDTKKFFESLRLSRKPDAFKRHIENSKTSETPIWVRLKHRNMLHTYVTNPKVTRCPDFLDNKEDDISTMELYRHHKYYLGSHEGDSNSDDSVADLLKHYERYTPALNRFEKSESSKIDSVSALKMDSDEDVSLWCHFNGTTPDIKKLIIPRKYIDDNTRERKPFTATFYNRNVVITRYYPPTIEKILPPALRRRITTKHTTPIVQQPSPMDTQLVEVEPKLPMVFPTQRVTTPRNIDPYGLLHKIMNYNKMRQALYPNTTNAILIGEKPHRLHPLNQLPPLLKLPFALSQDLMVHTSDPKAQHFTILGDYRIHKDNRTLECVQNPVEFQRPLNAIAPPAGSGFYRLVQKYRIFKNRTLQMISGGSKPKESNAILRVISKRRKGSNTIAVEMRFYPLPSTVSKLRKGRIPHYLLR